MPIVRYCEWRGFEAVFLRNLADGKASPKITIHSEEAARDKWKNPYLIPRFLFKGERPTFLDKLAIWDYLIICDVEH